MLKIQYKSKWYPVKEIAKCDDQVTYILDGVQGKVYARDVEDATMEKEDTHEIVNPDGSIVRSPGKEPLRKPLKKSLKQRWEYLKKKLNHEKAFYPMTAEEEEKGDQQNDQQEVSNDVNPDDSLPNEVQQDGDSRGDSDSKPDKDDKLSSDAQPADEISDETFMQQLKEEGYTDAEIAHILHGHVPKEVSQEQMDAQVHQQDLGHNEEHHKLDIKNKDIAASMEHEHNKKIKDLEYEYAKREKDLRIKYLEQELQAKMDALRAKKESK